MKIAMILDQQFPIDDRVEKEALTLIKNGHNVVLLCLTFGDYPKQENYKNIFITRVYMPRQVFKKLSALILTLPFYHWFWKRKITKFISDENPDAIHIHDLPLCGIGAKIKQIFNLPLIADMHENYPIMVEEMAYANTFPGNFLINKKKWYNKEKEWLSQADKIIVVAPEMKNRLKKIISAEINFAVVPNTIDVRTFEKSQKPCPEKKQGLQNYFVITYFGGIDSVRGIETLIDAANLLKDKIKTLKILIVGSGALLESHQQKSRELRLTDIIQFEGRQDPSCLNSYMEQTDLCVIPHLKSPQTDNSSPNKLFIYMFFKKALIVSNCNSIQKIIEDAKCGLVYESGNSHELADRILQLYNNPEKTVILGENGHKALLRKYNWNKTSQPLIDLYSNLKTQKDQ